jgi:hypothetical protein
VSGGLSNDCGAKSASQLRNSAAGLSDAKGTLPSFGGPRQAGQLTEKELHHFAMITAPVTR